MANSNDALTVQEPNDLTDSYLTDETAERTAVLVYTQDTTSAGIKKIGIAPWKRYLGFDPKLVHNLAKLVGFERSEYDASGSDIPTPDKTLKGVVNAICQQIGISYAEVLPPTSTLLARTQTLENSVNGYNDEEEVHHEGLIEKVEANATNIASLAEEIGSSSGGGGTLTSRIDTLESSDATQNGKISTLESTVGNSTSGSDSGLCLEVKTLKTTVGDASSGLVGSVATLNTTVGDSGSGLVKNVDDLQTDVNTLETTVGSGSSGLVGDVETLKNKVGDNESGLVKDGIKNKTDISSIKGWKIVKTASDSTPIAFGNLGFSEGFYQVIFVKGTNMLSSVMSVTSGNSISLLTLAKTEGSTEDDFYYTNTSSVRMLQSNMFTFKIGELA